MKYKMNLIGGCFSHSISSDDGENKYVEWVKNTHTEPVSFYVDHSVMLKPNPNYENYAWLCESRTINPTIYQWCIDNIETLKENFINVFTHDYERSKLSNIFVLTQCSVRPRIYSELKIFDKSKLVSMVASNKVMCKEHQYRQQMIEKFRHKCDHFGRGYNNIPHVIDGLKDYCFSIAMENATYPNMITEKLTNCFATGTIPIYYGIKNIGDFFNSDGIITLNDNFEIESLSYDSYYSKMLAIEENFKLATELLSAEDYIYLNFIK